MQQDEGQGFIPAASKIAFGCAPPPLFFDLLSMDKTTGTLNRDEMICCIYIFIYMKARMFVAKGEKTAITAIIVLLHNPES